MKRATGILPLEYPHAQDGYGKSVSAVPLCRGDRRKLSIAGVEKRLQRLCDFCVSALKSENFCLAEASGSSTTYNLSLRDWKAGMLPATLEQACSSYSLSLRDWKAGMLSLEPAAPATTCPLRDRKAGMLPATLELAAPATACPCGTGKQGCFRPHWSQRLQLQPVPAGPESRDAFTGAGSSSHNLFLRDRKAGMLSLELAAPATTCSCKTGKQGCFRPQSSIERRSWQVTEALSHHPGPRGLPRSDHPSTGTRAPLPAGSFCRFC